MALEDARSAADADILVDDRSGALVILGDRGRTHFFAVEGRLVSSVRYSRDAIARKIKQGVWRRPVDDELARFRSNAARDAEPGPT
jgi:hypothetical protein